MTRWVATRRRFGWRLQRRSDYSMLRSTLFKVFAIALSLLIAGVTLSVWGENPLELGRRIIESTLGSVYGVQQLLIRATPIIITAAAVTLAGRMNLWNLGGEGQLFLGAWAAAGVGLFLGGNSLAMPVLIFLAAALAGGLLALGPALMRAKAGISEILTTILLNYIAVHFVTHFARGPWRASDVLSMGTFRTDEIGFGLPKLWGDLHVGFLIAIALVVVLGIVMRNSVWGYEIQSVGANQRAARYGGIAVERNMLIVMFLSGAIAGIAGAIEATGVVHRLTPTVSVGYAWDGWLVSILGGQSFIAVLPYGLFIAALRNAGIVLQTTGLSYSSVLALTGLILLLAGVAEVVAKYRIVRVGSAMPLEGEPPDRLRKTEEAERIERAGGRGRSRWTRS